METIRTTRKLQREAERCERLYHATYDPVLADQLLSLARDYRGEADRLLAQRHPPLPAESAGATGGRRAANDG